MAVIRKDTRIDLRIENTQKDFLVYAATIVKMKLSAFVLSCAIKEAEEIVANKTNFTLPDAQWKAFNAALDRPARDNPKLKKLFRATNVFHK